MLSFVCGALCAAALSGPQAAGDPAAPGPMPAATVCTAAKQSVIQRLTGPVGARNAGAFAGAVSDQMDKIIGLKVRVSPLGQKSGGYQLFTDGDLLSISANQGSDQFSIAVPKKDVALLGGDWVIDGYFIVRNGGMHQGILAYGLEKVDEGAIRTNPAIRIIDHKL